MLRRRLLMLAGIPIGMLFLVAALTGCARVSAQAPAPTPVAVAAQTAESPDPVALRSDGDTIVASGEVVPAREAQLGFTVSGRIQSVGIAEGNPVESGDVLVTLHTDLVQTSVTRAEAALAAAQAQQTLTEAGPRPGEVAAAQAELRAAEARLAEAAAGRDQLTAGAIDAELAAARAQLAAAQAEEKAAQEALRLLRDQKAQEWKQEVASLRLRAAGQNLAAAEARLALADKDALAQVRAAQATVQVAAAQRDVAQAQLDLLQASATPEEVAAAEADVDQTQASLEAARATLDQATLRAPFAGTIASLDVAPGETILPGQIVLVLAELDRLQVETTDLSERDVAHVRVGQSATVRIEPLGIDVPGRVADVALQATTVGGDVVYTVVIELDEQPAGLRWGMSARVEIATKPGSGEEGVRSKE